MDRDINDVKVPKRILSNLLASLEAGVVPRSGAPYIAIGRGDEIASLLDNLDTVAEGGAAVRFLIGRFGSGKSFLIQLIRGYALDRDFLSADADLSPERKLSGVGGIATYRELMRNLACKTSPDGGALPTVLSRLFVRLKEELINDGIFPESAQFEPVLKQRVYHTLSALEGGVGGFELARVLGEYYSALSSGNEEVRSACLRWMRGEFATKTEARQALGFRVGGIIDDSNWYDYLKLWATFSKILGYKGLLVYIDECINLYKIPNRISRESNYEKLLSIFNDTLQGRANYLGVFFGGTPQFLEDTRRGLFSYDALRSRLSDSRFSEMGYHTLSAPVIRLRRLSDNELLALVKRLARLYQQKVGGEALVTEEQMAVFLSHELSRAGASEMVTPREIIRDFLTLLAILHENPQADFTSLVTKVAVSTASLNEISARVDDESAMRNPAEQGDNSRQKIGLSDIVF